MENVFCAICNCNASKFLCGNCAKLSELKKIFSNNNSKNVFNEKMKILIKNFNKEITEKKKEIKD